MIVINTDMESMPKSCKECVLCDKTTVTKEYYCKQLLEDITDVDTKLKDCPLIETFVCYNE